MEVRQDIVQPIGETQPHHRALVTQRSVGHPPALIQGPDQVFGRHSHVGEEHLVEVQIVLPADGRERPAHDAGSVGGDQQHANPLVLGRIWVRPHKGQQHISIVRA